MVVVPEFIVVHAMGTLPFLVFEKKREKGNVENIAAYCISAVISIFTSRFQIFFVATPAAKSLWQKKVKQTIKKGIKPFPHPEAVSLGG